jgi:sterol-4alpha-carboxylate 3-dehydrogenase (decarboxylating)
VPFWVFTGEILTKSGYTAPTKHVPAGLVMSIAYLLQLVAMLLSPFMQWKPFLTPFKVALASTDHYYNCDKAKRLLGYQPPISLRQGIDITCDYYGVKQQEK